MYFSNESNQSLDANWQWKCHCVYIHVSFPAMLKHHKTYSCSTNLWCGYRWFWQVLASSTNLCCGYRWFWQVLASTCSAIHAFYYVLQCKNIGQREKAAGRNWTRHSLFSQFLKSFGSVSKTDKNKQGLMTWDCLSVQINKTTNK